MNTEKNNANVAANKELYETIAKELSPSLKQAADLTTDWLNTHQELIKALSGRIGEGLVTSVELLGKSLPIIAENIDAIKSITSRGL